MLLVPAIDAARFPPRSLRGLLLAVCMMASLAVPPAQAQQSSPAWEELSAKDQHILEPLASRWDGLTPTRRQKWLNVAKQYPRLDPEQQARLRERMLEWVDLSTDQRNNARASFTEVKTLPPAERQARWEAYNALPEADRQELARKATVRLQSAQRSASSPAAVVAPPTQPKALATDPTRGTNGKAQPVGLGVVQASVGASTRPISEAPVKPRHQQAGMPKILTGPGFVDRTTLLPQRGPQGAVTPSPAASATQR